MTYMLTAMISTAALFHVPSEYVYSECLSKNAAIEGSITLKVQKTLDYSRKIIKLILGYISLMCYYLNLKSNF